MFAWSEEITLLCLTWFTFMGIAIGFRERLHLGMDLFEKLPPNGPLVLRPLIDLVTFFFGLYLVIYGWDFAMMMRGSILAATQLPNLVQYIVMPITGVMTCVYSGAAVPGPGPAPLQRHRRGDQARCLSNTVAIWILCVTFVGFLLLRFPVALVLVLSSIATLWYLDMPHRGGGAADDPGHQRLLPPGDPLLHPDGAAARGGRPRQPDRGLRQCLRRPASRRAFHRQLGGLHVLREPLRLRRRRHLGHRLGHDPDHGEEGLLGRVCGRRDDLLGHPGRRRSPEPQPGALLDRGGRASSAASRSASSSWPASSRASSCWPPSRSSASSSASSANTRRAIRSNSRRSPRSSSTASFR